MDELRYVFLVSSVQLVPSAAAAKEAPYAASASLQLSPADPSVAVSIGVAPAGGAKCDRCWNFSSLVGPRGTSVGQSPPANQLCGCAASGRCGQQRHSSSSVFVSLSLQVGRSGAHPLLCERCIPVVQAMGMASAPPAAAPPAAAAAV